MTTTPETLVTQEELDKAFDGTNFGDRATPREILANNLLKISCGFATGFTIQCIMENLKLKKKSPVLTQKGKHYLWLTYSDGKSL